jgi:taurine dioxygenase
MSKLQIRRLSSAAGAEVRGLDLTKPVKAEHVEQIHKALGENCVLLFRGQELSPDQQIAFSRHFGDLESHVLSDVYGLPGKPEILVISNVKTDEGKLKGAPYAGQYWHSDVSYTAQPPLGSLLHCFEMPEVGGDTMFANMYLAYETLSDTMKAFLLPLKAIHDYNKVFLTVFADKKERKQLTAEQLAKVPPIEQPMIRTHPVTKRKALYVNEGFTTGIAGMPNEESRPILEFLFKHSTRAEFIYRHKWQVHDLIFWDNRCVMHYALSDYDFSVRRHMHRTTVMGDRPF